MNAASLQRTAAPAATGTAKAAAPAAGAAAGGITPMAGQGFVPVAGAPAQGAADPKDGSVPAEQALAALVKVLAGKDGEFGEPIVAADGTVYMERRTPSVVNGSLSLSYVVAGKIDPATGRMTLSPAILEAVKVASEGAGGSERKLVKVDDQYVWQTFSKTEDGKTIAEVTPATKAELQQYQQQVQTEQAKQAAQAKLEDRGDWQSKVGTVAQQLGLFGSTGQLISSLASGPNPYTGKPGAGWVSGWILAQRLNGKAEGKLLPAWMQDGPVATALEWGMQAYGMLDMGRDIGVVRDYLKGTTKPPPAVNPGAVAQLVAQGQHPAVAEAMAGLGAELRVPLDPSRVGSVASQLVEGSSNAALLRSEVMPALDAAGKPMVDAAGKAIAGEVKSALTMVPKSDLQAAFGATGAAQDAGARLRDNVDGGIVKGIGLLKGLVQPAMIGATALGVVSNVINVRNIIDTKGASALLDTQQGRGAVLGALSSAAFLGMYTLPMILPGLGIAAPAIAMASSAVSIASNVLGGVQMLNSYGLFGEQGFLDNDAFRAAFLVPPLTPIGAFAFWMKSRSKKREEEGAKLEAAKQVATDRIQQQREMAKLQLQSTGKIAGAVPGADGAINVSTNVPQDLTKLVAQMAGVAPAAPVAAAPVADSGANAALQQQRQQLTMTARPV